MKAKQNAYTLLEVVLATAVMAIGLVVVFGMMNSARKKATDASELADVQLQCQTLLNEELAKQTPIKPMAPRPLTGIPNWYAGLFIYPTANGEMYAVHIAAQKLSPIDGTPQSAPFHLIRWVSKHRAEIPQESNIMTEEQEFTDPFL
ncbi:MAG: type II secretion system GspH family protein [Planctomycetaceae bacterium]|nr:type II secretion system GspH family protein [Planctomycetaceae bacterium]